MQNTVQNIVQKNVQNIIQNIDPDGAARAFEAMLPLLDAQNEIRRNNINIDKAIIHAASVGRMVKQPEVRARFANLPAGEFDQLCVDRLETTSLAAWYVTVSRNSASVQSSGTKIAESDIEAGVLLKQRMIKVIDYHVGHLTEVSTELDSIREGTGYLDMASDLLRLGALYLRYIAEISGDTRHYRAEDREEAGRLAHTVHQVLGDGRDTDARYWNGYLPRAWSLMVDTYEEVSAAGRWLYRHENGEQRFPSLYAIGRQRRSRRPDEDAPEGNDGNDSPNDNDSPDQGDVIAG
jgi:hypothetical protein